MKRSTGIVTVAAVLTTFGSHLEAQAPTESLLGRSERGLPIRMLEWNAEAGRPILVFGGIHGDERSAGDVAMRLEQHWRGDASPLQGVHVLLITIANPDGWKASTRKNANGVDLNRNFPAGWARSDPGSASYGGARALSEAESRILYDLVERARPKAILSIHSCRSCGGVDNYDGPAAAQAEAMARVNGYKPTPEWDVPTPGSFGTYAGKSKNIPTITLEIPRNVRGESELTENVRAIDAFVRTSSR